MLTERKRFLAWARTGGGTIGAAEAAEAGFHSQTLTRLVHAGVLERISRGVYRIADAEVTESHGIVLASKAVPDAVVCLLSALAFHEVGTQLPSKVWLAIERGRRTPRAGFPPARYVRVSGEAFYAGIEEHWIEGQLVRIYNLPKTIADCFKFRNRIGLDVAIEALSDAYRNRRVRPADVEPFAKICRVDRIMRPYMETLAG